MTSISSTHSNNKDNNSNIESIILEEEYDENYEPTEQDILEYAYFLGIIPDKEPHLLWIAREGLKAPLPKDWKPCQADDGQVYYFNFKTGESVWEHPCDEMYRKIYETEKSKNPVPPSGWRVTDKIAALIRKDSETKVSKKQVNSAVAKLAKEGKSNSMSLSSPRRTSLSSNEDFKPSLTQLNFERRSSLNSLSSRELQSDDIGPKQKNQIPNNEKHKEILTRMVHEKADEVRKQVEDFEKEERLKHEKYLNQLKKTLEDEKETIVQKENKRITVLIEEMKENIKNEYQSKQKAEEQKLSEQFEIKKAELKKNFDFKLEQETKMHQIEYDKRIKELKQELDLKYREDLDENGYKIKVEKAKKEYEEKLSAELDSIRLTYDQKKKDLIKQMEDSIDQEKRKLEFKLKDSQTLWNQKLSTEESQREAELVNLQAKHSERVRLLLLDFESKEKTALTQLSENHNRTLREKELEYQKVLEDSEFEWQERISKLKQKLADQQTQLEEKLLKQKSSTGLLGSTTSYRRQELEQLTKENDEIFLQQQRRRDHLNNEKQEMEKLEKDILLRKQELEKEAAFVKASQISTKRLKQNPKANEAENQGRSEELVHETERAGDFKEEEDDEDEIDALDNPRLKREIKRRLKREERVLNITKDFLKEQSELINSRKNELEETRRRWTLEVDSGAIGKKDDVTHEVVEFSPGNELQSLDEELSKVLDDLRSSSRLVDRESKSAYIPNITPKNFSISNPSNNRTQNLKISDKPMTGFTSFKTTSTAKQLASWEEERKRSDELLKRHLIWLNQFKTRLGQERFLH